MAALDEYRKKRNFNSTPEPAGEVTPGTSEAGGLFVVHKHDATRLHYDLRLEQGGVFRSWAVPRGPSNDPGDRRLAVHVEDHPLEYGDFEGVIPEGEYGGGTVMLWDRGRWKPAGKLSDDHIDFELNGTKLQGTWSLIRMRGRDQEDEDNWLLIRRSGDGGKGAASEGRSEEDRGGEDRGDEDRSVASGRTMRQIAKDRDAVWTADGPEGNGAPGRLEPSSLTGARDQVLPERVEPQLATLVESAPATDDWVHEIKFDGYRILARVAGGTAGLSSRNGKDWSDRFPEIAALLGGLRSNEAILDGEVVAYLSDGSTSFRLLQESLSAERTEELVYQAFDLLHLNGYDLTGVPLLERKALLGSLLARSGFTGSSSIRYSDHIEGRGPGFYEQACGLGLEGIISKRADGRYRSGRGRNWLKVKCSRQQELLVGGFTDPAGSRTAFGALLLGAYDGQGRLRYTGKVGTGFSDRLLGELHDRLLELQANESPFEPSPPGRGVHWVRPELVVEVEFTEWTRDGSLRHPTFRGVREDKDPAQILLPAEADGAEAAGPTGGSKGGDGSSKRGTGKGRRGPGGGGKGGSRAKGRGGGKGDAAVAGVRLSSPDRVLYPEQGATKLAIARYYEEIADWVLPHVANRPLSLVRCPQGHEKQCFFQKHPGEGLFEGIARIEIEEKDGPEPYLYVRTLPDLVSLVQGGVLELHVWGSRVDDVERPDLLVFDLDPGPNVPWGEMLRVAKEVRERLTELGLESFPRTTGGKGLHVVVPLRRGASWDEAKEFAQAVANAQASDDRSRVTTNMSKAKRSGRIFLDYLRNGRGATAIASYSTRAKEGATVAVPVRWDEVTAALRPDRYNIDNLRRRLSALSGDPWEGFDDARRPITAKAKRAVGLK